MFLLIRQEATNLKSQIVTSSWGGRRKLPYAFTEQGVAMLSSLLRSKRAIQVNITIMRAFVRLRQLLASHSELAQKIEEHEKRIDKHDKHIIAIFEIIKELMKPMSLPPPQKPKPPIGFHP
jgi:DNA-binding PadR family transcriptional regulator